MYILHLSTGSCLVSISMRETARSTNAIIFPRSFIIISPLVLQYYYAAADRTNSRRKILPRTILQTPPLSSRSLRSSVSCISLLECWIFLHFHFPYLLQPIYAFESVRVWESVCNNPTYAWHKCGRGRKWTLLFRSGLNYRGGGKELIWWVVTPKSAVLHRRGGWYCLWPHSSISSDSSVCTGGAILFPHSYIHPVARPMEFKDFTSQKINMFFYERCKFMASYL